jgi:hypothetical protein
MSCDCSFSASTLAPHQERLNREDRKGHAKIAKKIWGISSGLGIEGAVTEFMWMGYEVARSQQPVARIFSLRRELCVTNVTSKNGSLQRQLVQRVLLFW